MKKYVSLFILFLVFVKISGQQAFNVFKNDMTVSSVAVSDVDSIKFSLLPTKTMSVFKADKTTSNFLMSAVDSLKITDNFYLLPQVEITSATYNYTTQKTLCIVDVKSNGGCQLIERGICWSKLPNPTTKDSKFSGGITTGKFYALTDSMNVNETYYIRSFASNCLGTFYSKAVKIQPLMGNVTYTLAIDSATNPTPYKLIKQAMDSAIWYYNRYTTFRGNIYVYYNAGIPTAQASYHGSIGFGASTDYMWVGTAMHEMAHFMGSGTTNEWKAKLSGGVWTGTVANTLLQNATGETLKGDGTHYWPTGINYKSEITNLGGAAAQQNALILHCKIVKAMVVDDAGLPNSW
ncbi:MAG: hypothetical protein ACK5L7_03025 [Paludibacteraceae bacterium]